MLYVIFGEMGTGKNYVGERLAKHIGCEFFDGDTVIPKVMLDKIINFKSLDTNDIDNYVYFYLIPEIGKRSTNGLSIGTKDLVISQALYRNTHRETIKFFFGEENVRFIWLPVFSVFTHMKRLFSRKNGLKWMLYGLYNKFFFQEPDSNTKIIDNSKNDNEKELLVQFKNIK